MAKGKLWVIEGPDLAGKDTVLNTMKDYARGIGKKVFDVREFWTAHNRHPTLLDIMAFGKPDLIVYAEPSTVNIGKLIRGVYTTKPEMNGTGLHYLASFVARQFADDREEMIYSFVSPAREVGIDALCGRNYLSSLVYQPLHAKMFNNEILDRKYILALDGNRLAMKVTNAPDEILITTCSSEKLPRRRDGRAEKQDDSLYEEDAFLEALVDAYNHGFVRHICKKTGTTLSYHYTNGTFEDTIVMARREAKRLFGK